MLSQTQVEKFVSDGYVTFRVQLPRDLRRRAIDLSWSLCPPSFERRRSSTWQGELTDSMCTMSIQSRNGWVKFRDSARRHAFLRDLLVTHPEVTDSVATLIRDPLPMFRGLYPVFPIGFRSVPRTLYGHCDRHHFQVGVVVYLSDVNPGKGGFTVWPGSHTTLAPASRRLHAAKLGSEKPWTDEEYVNLSRSIQRDVAPVEIAGRAGTVILWHQFLMHSAGYNFGRSVRQALLCDFVNRAYGQADLSAIGTPFDSTWAPAVQKAAAGASISRPQSGRVETSTLSLH